MELEEFCGREADCAEDWCSREGSEEVARGFGPEFALRVVDVFGATGEVSRRSFGLFRREER